MAEPAPTAATPAPAPPRRLRGKRRRIHKHRDTALSSAPVKNEINVTPLVDVVLVLLIIFMVVTPMIKSGVQVQLPQTRHHDKKDDRGERLQISISSDGKVFVDRESFEGEQLVEGVRRAMRKKDGGAKEIHVKGDKRLTYGEVRKVLEKIHEAGAPNVALGSDEIKKDPTNAEAK